MKVINDSAQNLQKSPAKKLSQDDIKAKIAAKFGEKAKIVKPKIEDTAELNSKAVSHSEEKGFGDIGVNDPKSSITQDKLKDLLKSGAFAFNDRERKILGEILK